MNEQSDISEELQKAEEARLEGNKTGDYSEAIRLAKEHGAISSIAAEDPTILRDKAKLWRDETVSETSQGNRQENGNKAAENFARAAEVIRNKYDPFQERIRYDSQLQTLDREDPYHLPPEMKRDEGKLNIAIFSLTGNPIFLADAITAFNQAITLSEEGSSAEGLAKMERFQSQRMLQQVPRDQQPITQEEKPQFSQLREGYNQVMSSGVGGKDRKSAASRAYMEESISSHHFLAAFRGIKNFGIQNALDRLRGRGERKRLEVQRKETFTGNVQDVRIRK